MRCYILTVKNSIKKIISEVQTEKPKENIAKAKFNNILIFPSGFRPLRIATRSLLHVLSSLTQDEVYHSIPNISQWLENERPENLSNPLKRHRSGADNFCLGGEVYHGRHLQRRAVPADQTIGSLYHSQDVQFLTDLVSQPGIFALFTRLILFLIGLFLGHFGGSDVPSVGKWMFNSPFLSVNYQ